jgi:galactokinase
MTPTFEQLFAIVPEAVAEAPGRVNLLGEHTDYSGGFVLPVGTTQRTRIEIAASDDELFHVFAVNLNELASFHRGQSPPRGFERYAVGCVAVLESAGFAIPAFRARLQSEVPIGVGLSSSAAFEVALLRALRQWLSLPLNDVDVARLAQRAEIDYTGVRCGIMDQMASSLGDERHMLFLDTRNLAYRLEQIPTATEVLVIDSGTSRQLASSAYNLRREQCETAAHLLGVASLRDADDMAAIAALPPPYNRRARHVVTENRRVLSALDASPSQFGVLMNESHASLRDDYEVSAPALDALVSCLQDESAVYGARLTGAGFGGACVALAQRGEGAGAASSALRHYKAMGFVGGRQL